MQSNIPYILLFSFISFFCLEQSYAQDTTPKTRPILAKKIQKPLLKKDSTLLLKATDTIRKDSITQKSSIEGIITHDADGYTLQDVKKKQTILYDNAHITYQDIDLKAGIIIVDNKNNTLFAKGIIDSLGVYQQRAIFKQGNQDSEQDSLFYNFKTKKALIYGLKTIQSGMITYGEKTKRVNDSTIYIKNIRFTTSEKDNPDYYIKTKKAKLVPGKKIIVGLSNLVIADVPTPVFLPFAYLPLGNKRTSGLIIPTWGESSNQGYFLQNGGYYLAINDYLDISLLGDIYTNGSWGLRTESSYVVRYKYSGNFSLRFENLIQSLRGFDDYSKSTNFNIRWSHSQDSKSNPNSRISASVNLGSSQYYRESLNQVNSSDFLTNTLSSSISYYRKFVGTPFNINATATHSQNTNTKAITMTLPSLQLNMDRIYPFAGKGGVKKNALQKIGFNYNMSGDYRINTVDSLFFKSAMFKTAKTGVQHNADFSTNMKVLKYFTLSPNASYKEVWNFDYINKRYEDNAIINDTLKGFKSFREYRSNVSLSTAIYGLVNFKKGRLKSIRHTIRPSISYGYRPDFADKYNQQVQQSEDPTDLLTYSPFENGIYGRPSSGLSNSIGFSINNVLEAKVASRDSTEVEDKKITLLNNLNFNASYNFAADSLRWSPVSISAGTRILKDKLSINMNASLDPYQVNSAGTRIDKFNRGLFRLTNINASANYSISSKDFEKKNGRNASNKSKSSSNQVNDSRSSSPNQQQEPEVKETKLYEASIPWSLNLSYAINYSNNGLVSGIGSNTLMFNGNLELSPKWKVRFSSGYDFENGGYSFTRLGFSRDLDSWSFNFDWSPFGYNKSYYFRIGVNSSMLSDLKWEKRSLPDRRLF
ncbi:MAG: putative LPS assembly protein LptD [Polaribacter sp.]|nr:putative LPS assembly protein LptD [Polaribacter sp.]